MTEQQQECWTPLNPHMQPKQDKWRQLNASNTSTQTLLPMKTSFWRELLISDPNSYWPTTPKKTFSSSFKSNVSSWQQIRICDYYNELLIIPSLIKPEITIYISSKKILKKWTSDLFVNFIYCWLRWVFTAVHRFSLVAVCELFIMVVSFASEHRLWVPRLQ